MKSYLVQIALPLFKLYFLDTLAPQHESTLEDLKKEALYISQDWLRELQEIAEGRNKLCYKLWFES